MITINGVDVTVHRHICQMTSRYVTLLTQRIATSVSTHLAGKPEQYLSLVRYHGLVWLGVASHPATMQPLSLVTPQQYMSGCPLSAAPVNGHSLAVAVCGAISVGIL